MLQLWGYGRGSSPLEHWHGTWGYRREYAASDGGGCSFGRTLRHVHRNYNPACKKEHDYRGRGWGEFRPELGLFCPSLGQKSLWRKQNDNPYRGHFCCAGIFEAGEK